MVTKVITVEYEKKIQKRFNGSHETYIKNKAINIDMHHCWRLYFRK